MSSVPRALTQALTWHFQSGTTRLCVVADDFRLADLAPCAAEAAVVLDMAGELLDALDTAGLATAEPWQWVAQVGAAPGGAQASWRGVEAEARLTVPWAVLRASADAPDVPGLQWHPAPAECVLAQWRLGDDERAALEPGGLLLLDGAAGERLRARGETVGDEQPLQLVARWEQPLSLDVVLGWTTTRPAPPAACQLIETARPDTVLARGRLVPWGTGQAFRIEHT
jgi:hypothetical protein